MNNEEKQNLGSSYRDSDGDLFYDVIPYNLQDPFFETNKIRKWCLESGKCLESAFRDLRNFPQYCYVARPIYKLMGGKKNPLVSVPVSFMVSDLIMHKLLPGGFYVAFNYLFKTNNKLTGHSTILAFHIIVFAIWTGLSFPVAWYKHVSNQKDKFKDASKLF